MEDVMVFFTLEAVMKIRVYACNSQGEVAGVGRIEECGNDLIVTDAFTLKQSAGVGHAHFDEGAFNKFCYDFEDNGGKLSELRLQWHSHGNMEAYFSYMDYQNIENCVGDYRVSLVVNKRDGYQCRLDRFKPAREGAEVPFMVLLPAPEPIVIKKELAAACKKEMAKNVFVDILWEPMIMLAETAESYFMGAPPKKTAKTISFRNSEWIPLAYRYLNFHEER